MRIFTAVRHSSDPKYYYGGLWSGNFYPAIQQLGHEIIESQVDLLPVSRFMSIPGNFKAQELEARSKITAQIIAEVRQQHQEKPIDLFLSYFYNAHFDPDGFEEIHGLGIPTVNFYCNSIHQFPLVSDIAVKANFAWHAEKNARDLYLGVGANPVWVQMGADPTIYHPLFHQNRERKACFVGQRYGDRDRYLTKLIGSKVAVDIYGKGWGKPNASDNTEQVLQKEESVYLGRRSAVADPVFHPGSPPPGSLMSYTNVTWKNIKTQGVFGGLKRTIDQLKYRQEGKKLAPLLTAAVCGFAENISDTFAQYEVILNFSNVWADGRPGSQLIPHVRLRDFEAPMCRTCYLTGYTEEIGEFYQLGKEIDTYKSKEELVDKTKFYLNHPHEAEKLREAGYQRALRDHTWKSRLQQLFKIINNKK